MESIGIQKITQVLDLVELVATDIGRAIAKDGFQMSDLVAFLDDAAFRERFVAASQNLIRLPAEAGDISTKESFEVGFRVLGVSRAIFEAFKKSA